MNINQKHQIKELVREEIDRLGGQRAVATKIGVSAATISQIVNDNWSLIADSMWSKVAASVGYSEDNWKVVDNTFNMRVLETTFKDAKTNSMFMCVSHKAGSGKTAGSKLFVAKNKKRQVYYIYCREWSIKQFLAEICKQLGIEQPRGYVSADALLAEIVDFFLIRSNHRPLLIIDEADKLKGSALRSFIPLYNATEDKLGIVILGTENLSQEIKRGVRYNKKGYDEIDSRLGRQFIKLYGASKSDVKKICKENGIGNDASIKQIWEECSPKEILVGDKFLPMIDDLRRLKRVIQREKIEQASN